MALPADLSHPFPALRPLSLLLALGLFLQSCQSVALSVFASESLPLPKKQAVGDKRPRYRIVLLDFSNSAAIEEFAVAADADLINASGKGEMNLKGTSPAQKKVNLPSQNQPPGEAGEGSQTNEVAPKKAKPDPKLIESNSRKLAGAARTITETALFQTGRFELIPAYQFRATMQKYLSQDRSSFEARQLATKELKIDYFLYGDLTDFEIKTTSSYWKVPFWAILLIGSFFIEDRRTRDFIWYALLRAATIVPLNSALWRAGLGKEDLELKIRIALDLRLVDAKRHTVAFAVSKTTIRKEQASNLELAIWQEKNTVRIKQSNAGKQMRYAALAAIQELIRFIDSTQTQAP